MPATASDTFNIMPSIYNFIIGIGKYLLSPAVTVIVFWFIIKKAYNLGATNKELKDALNDIKTLKTDTSKLVKYVDIIRTHLVSALGMDANLFTAGSPLQLTEKGESLLEKSNFEKIYLENKDEFLNMIMERGAKTLSEIDEAATKLMEEMKDDNRLIHLKDVAFKNGTTVDVLLKVCAIFLRGEVAKELKITK